MLQALGNSIGVRAFQGIDSDGVDAHLQWFLLQVLELTLTLTPNPNPNPNP